MSTNLNSFYFRKKIKSTKKYYGIFICEYQNEVYYFHVTLKDNKNKIKNR